VSDKAKQRIAILEARIAKLEYDREKQNGVIAQQLQRIRDGNLMLLDVLAAAGAESPAEVSKAGGPVKWMKMHVGTKGRVILP
jgi:hypothetical protein